MRRFACLLAGVLLSVVALASDSPKSYDGETEAIGLVGKWQLTEREVRGVKENLGIQGRAVLTFRDGTFTSNVIVHG